MKYRITRMRAYLVLGILVFAHLAHGQDNELRRAAQFDSEHKCEDAERLYQQALEKPPSSVALLNNLGNHYLICGHPTKAELYFVRLLKINPSHANSNLQLARLATQRKQGALALRYLANVKDASPAVRLLRAEALQNDGRRSEALSIVADLEREASSDIRVQFAIGITCARMGLYDKAEEAFNRVLVSRPNDFNVLFNLGRAAARAQHYDRAKRAFEVAIKIQPDDVDVLLELGLVYAAVQDYRRSVFVLAQARQRAPKRPDLLLALAKAAEDAGFYGDSVVAYDEYLQIAPNDDIARRDRGRVVGHTGTRRKEGIHELTMYVQKHPRDAVGYYYLAQLMWTTSPEVALDQLLKALRLDPAFAPAQYARGWLLYRLGRTAEARVHLEAAVRLQPENALILDQLGLNYLSLDQPAEAERVLRRALTIAPRNPEVLMHLGRSLVALNREEEAQQYLSEFRRLRSERSRDPRREAGMLELATMSEADRILLQINRLRDDVRTHPSDPELALHLAGLLLLEGQTAEALATYREVLAVNADAGILQEAGTVLARAGQYEMARDFLERVAPDKPKARLDLAIALFFTGGPQQALTAMDEVPNEDRGGDYLLMKARFLDAAGRSKEAESVLQEGLRQSSSRTDVAQTASSLLVQRNRLEEALGVLQRARKANPSDPDLLLELAIVLALADRAREAEAMLKQIESRWPEWDRPYVADGLFLESVGRTAEARQKLQTSFALGSNDLAARCAVSRLEGRPSPTAKCVCAAGLRDLIAPACNNQP